MPNASCIDRAHPCGVRAPLDSQRRGGTWVGNNCIPPGLILTCESNFEYLQVVSVTTVRKERSKKRPGGTGRARITRVSEWIRLVQVQVQEYSTTTAMQPSSACTMRQQQSLTHNQNQPDMHGTIWERTRGRPTFKGVGKTSTIGSGPSDNQRLPSPTTLSHLDPLAVHVG
jgi:hypothetical protein